MKIRFEEFTLDGDARRLSRGGADVHLSLKAFDLLQLLIDRRPNVVDKADLHAAIWPDTFVFDANLSVLVAELRKALADNAREPRFIRTVHALGYAFCGEAVRLPEQPGVPAAGTRCWLIWEDRTIRVPEGASVIGRDPESAIWIDAAGVSRRHACIDVRSAGAARDVVRIEDLGSKNGTFVNGAAIEGPTTVADGAVVQIGTASLAVRIWPRGRALETERITRPGEPHRSKT